MRVWRLTRAAHARDTLSGRGAALVGGRWNSPGVRIVYASTHRSLALLEMLVHVQRDTVPPTSCSSRSTSPIASSDPLRHFPPAGMPCPGVPRRGSSGIAGPPSATRLAVLVPSIVVPAEENVLINPLHPQAIRLQAHPPEPFPLDQRLFA